MNDETDRRIGGRGNPVLCFRFLGGPGARLPPHHHEGQDQGVLPYGGKSLSQQEDPHMDTRGRLQEETEEGFAPGTSKAPEWQVASSPYVLQDQSLGSTVRVRAVDKAGNERLAVFVPAGFTARAGKKSFFGFSRKLVGLSVVLLGLLAAAFVLVYKMMK